VIVSGGTEKTNVSEETEPKKTYKGTDTTLAALQATGERYVPLQVLDTDYPGRGPLTKWDYNVPKAHMPRVVVMDTVTASGYKDLVKFTFHQQKDLAKRTVHVPRDWPVRVLTGRLGAELRKAHEEWQRANVATLVPYTKNYLGSDPEVFVELAGEVIPAWKFLGSKTRPDRGPPGAYGNNTLYWDGFQAEFTTTATPCIAFHVDSVRSGLRGVLEQAHKKYPDASLSLRSVVMVDEETLTKEANEAPEHVEFGCAPSYNAYGLKGEPLDGRSTQLRFAGCHIHIGCGVRPEKERIRIVHALDAILGVSCVSLFAEFDNPVRRQYYGLPGEYRTPAHGLEYRTLSNAWLVHPAIMHLVFDLARQAERFGTADLLKHWRSSPDEWVPIIAKHDVDGARRVLTENKTLLTALLKALYYTGNETAYNTILAGAHTVVEDPKDFVRNWRLGGGWTDHSESDKACWARAWWHIEAGKKL